MSPDAVNQAMNYLVTSQNVMLSTNQLMAVAGVIVFFAATLIGFAPRPTRTVQPGAAGIKPLVSHIDWSSITCKNLARPYPGSP